MSFEQLKLKDDYGTEVELYERDEFPDHVGLRIGSAHVGVVDAENNGTLSKLVEVFQSHNHTSKIDLYLEDSESCEQFTQFVNKHTTTNDD